MEIRLEGTGGGSLEIKMDFNAVVSELENARSALKPLKLSTVYTGINGLNKMQFIDEWIERENAIRSLLIEYMAIVEQNINDTKENVKMLKEQDESITRS